MHLLHAVPGASGTLALQADDTAIDRCRDLDDLDLWFFHAAYDAVLLDPIAHRGIGRRWAQRYRAQGGRAGLIFVVDDLAADLAIPLYGICDDLIRIPMRPDEVLARVGALVRRCSGYEQAALTVGPLVLDTGTVRARYDGRDLLLSKKQFAVLEFLMLRAGQVVTKEAILTRLYQEKDEAQIKIVDVFVCKLRARLREAGAPDDVIRTTWGNGFTIPRTPALPSARALRRVA